MLEPKSSRSSPHKSATSKKREHTKELFASPAEELRDLVKWPVNDTDVVSKSV